MTDATEFQRRLMTQAINNQASEIITDDKDVHRKILIEQHGEGNVWDTNELQRDFEVLGFMAPFCVVKRKSDGAKGAVMFQHNPRFYFDFKPA